MVEACLAAFETARVGGALENLYVGQWRRRLDARAITHAAQECLVGQITLLQIRRKDDQLLEWNFDLLARIEREEIHAPLKRDDPAIQQVHRRAALATEVVYDERAAVGFHLEGSLIETGRIAPSEVCIIEGEFAADDDQR